VRVPFCFSLCVLPDMLNQARRNWIFTINSEGGVDLWWLYLRASLPLCYCGG